MSEVEVRPDVDLNELYDQDVPCHACGNPAELRSMGHGCGRSDGAMPPYYKCLRCWQVWLTQLMRKAANRGGYIRCWKCHEHFARVDDFSDYRPF